MMQTFSKAVVVGWFYLNQKEIAATLCENRDKPKMNCCGKCQLHKAIAKDDKEQDKEPWLKYENKSGELFCSVSHFFIHPFQLVVIKPIAAHGTSRLTSISSEIFKPPC